MRRAIVEIIPWMFHRRLTLLGVVAVIGSVPLIAQLSVLTIARGQQLEAEARRSLINEKWLPTTRGRILDRKGRVLAVDRPNFAVAVTYDVITGQWAYREAARQAKKLRGPSWVELDAIEREALIDLERREFDARLDRMWDELARIAGVPRAEIDRRTDRIKKQVQVIAAEVGESQRLAREARMERGRAMVETPDLTRVVREQLVSHVVIRGLDDRAGFELLSRLPPENADAETLRNHPLPGVSIIDATTRAYLRDTTTVEFDLASFPEPIRDAAPEAIEHAGVAARILGRMRNTVHREDAQRRREHLGSVEHAGADRGRYRAGDSVGHTGVEFAREHDLRGLRGVVRTEIDSGLVERTDPETGGDVRLTLDVALQARVEALFDHSLALAMVHPYSKSYLPVDTPLYGAAAVVEIATGDILALTSSPTAPRDIESSPPWSDDPRAMPEVDRAVGRPYAPGSILKPILYVSAVTEGVLGADERIECTGHFLPDKPDRLRCWIFKQYFTTHTDQLGHALDGEDALAVSCNIFFYEVGKRLGPRRIVEWLKKFGVGDGSAERIAWAPAFDGAVGRAGATPTRGEAIQLGIGQGPVVWTPLHAACAYATLARGGLRLGPRLFADRPATRQQLDLNPGAVRRALEGLARATRDDEGTAFRLTWTDDEGRTRREPIFNAPGVSLLVKTGTATGETSIDAIAPDGSVERRRLDHAWTVCLVGPEGAAPTHVIAVVLEFGGSGGRVAGPVANQIIHALIREGHLPSAPPAAQR